MIAVVCIVVFLAAVWQVFGNGGLTAVSIIFLLCVALLALAFIRDVIS